jgi:hypothetical protein
MGKCCLRSHDDDASRRRTTDDSCTGRALQGRRPSVASRRATAGNDVDEPFDRCKSLLGTFGKRPLSTEELKKQLDVVTERIKLSVSRQRSTRTSRESVRHASSCALSQRQPPFVFHCQISCRALPLFVPLDAFTKYRLRTRARA